MTSSDRKAVGCILAILAVPMVAGGSVVASLATRPPPPPRPVAEPEPPPPPVTQSRPAATPAPTWGPQATPVPTPTVAAPASASAAAPAEERTAHAVWDAKVVRAEASKVAAGTRCTIEATVASTDLADLRLASGLTVRCGATRVFQADGLPANARIDVKEVAGVVTATAAYVLEYADDNVVLDTPHAVGSVVPESPPDAVLSFVIAGESRPVKGRLLADTPALPEFHAGAYSSPADDDEITGRVVTATGDTVVEAGTRCRIGFHYYGTVDGNDRCDALIVCGAAVVIGRPERFAGKCKRQGSRVLSVQDLEPGSIDHDPALDLDTTKARAWNDVDGSRWSVTIGLEPHR